MSTMMTLVINNYQLGKKICSGSLLRQEMGVSDSIVEDDNDYTIYRIPKPFEPGLIFGTLPEKSLGLGI